MVQSTSGLDYKICKLKENQKGKNICRDSDFVEFHTGLLTLVLVQQGMCMVNKPWKEITVVLWLLYCDNPKDEISDENEEIHYGEPWYFPNQVFHNFGGKIFCWCSYVLFRQNKILLNLISCVLIDDYFESKYWDFFFNSHLQTCIRWNIFFKLKSSFPF